MTKSKKTSKMRQKFDFRMKPKITTLLPLSLQITAMHSVCCCSLAGLKKKFFEEGDPPWPIFAPPWILPLGGSGRKTTTLVRDLQYFIHTKFHQNLSSGSGEEVEIVNCLTDRRQTTDAGQRVITIGHWSLRLLCPKKSTMLFCSWTLEWQRTIVHLRLWLKSTKKTGTVSMVKHLFFSLPESVYCNTCQVC